MSRYEYMSDHYPAEKNRAGGVWEFAEWVLDRQVKVTFYGKYSDEWPCRHVQHFRGNMGRPTWTVPLVAVGFNEGGYCSTGICAECVADAVVSYK